MKRKSPENRGVRIGPISADDSFKFECHPGVACFTKCCRNADMYLYPYDIVRLKNHLGITSDVFLAEYTVTAFRDNPYFPSVMLKMSPSEDKACPFLNDGGCSVYEHRPYSCRVYPVERAVSRIETKTKPHTFYFVACHPYCLGHNENRRLTISEWAKDQNTGEFETMNELWTEIDTVFRRNPWGEQGTSSPAFKMAFMACFNIDQFKKFIAESSFRDRFDMDAEQLQGVINSDAELLIFGFDWIKYFLTGTAFLKQKAE